MLICRPSIAYRFQSTSSAAVSMLVAIMGRKAKVKLSTRLATFTVGENRSSSWNGRLYIVDSTGFTNQIGQSLPRLGKLARSLRLFSCLRYRRQGSLESLVQHVCEPHRRNRSCPGRHTIDHHLLCELVNRIRVGQQDQQKQLL